MKKKTSENKSVINDTFQYTGTVTLKTIKGGKVTSSKTYHNNGGNELFNFLYNCLAGKYIDSSRPAYIVAYYKDAGENKYTANGSLNTISATIIEASSTEPACIEYRFILPYLSAYTSTGIDGFAVYNSSKNPISASAGDNVSTDYSMILELNENKKINKDETTLVVWRLQIENKNN